MNYRVKRVLIHDNDALKGEQASGFKRGPSGGKDLFNQGAIKNLSSFTGTEKREVLQRKSITS